MPRLTKKAPLPYYENKNLLNVADGALLGYGDEDMASFVYGSSQDLNPLQMRQAKALYWLIFMSNDVPVLEELLGIVEQDMKALEEYSEEELAMFKSLKSAISVTSFYEREVKCLRNEGVCSPLSHE